MRDHLEIISIIMNIGIWEYWKYVIWILSEQSEDLDLHGQHLADFVFEAEQRRWTILWVMLLGPQRCWYQKFAQLLWNFIFSEKCHGHNALEVILKEDAVVPGGFVGSLLARWRRWRATTSGVAGDLRETLWGRRVQHIWKTSKDVQSHRSKAKQETIRKHHEKVWKSKEKQTGLPEWPECNSLQIQMHLQTTMATFGTSKVHMSSWHAMTPFIPINLICFCQAICFSWLDKLPQECVDWLQKRGAKEVGLVGHSRGGVTISQLEGDFCRVTWKRKQK